MPIGSPSSVENKEDLYAGEWPRVYCLVDPMDPVLTTEIYLGAVKGGVLRTSREEIQFLGTDFPATLEVSVPSNVGMQFTGTAYELTYNLLHLLVGDARVDDDGQYVYPGAACAFGDIDVTLRGERANCDGNMLVFQLHRARASGVVELGSNATDFIGTPMELNALDDKGGDFGGSTDDPLGWIWASRPTGL
ncbi:MAG: hypothetical protein GY871_04455 [Actinomycetales bacterium]|nr:hypothetical protein [Actinomycetales bacterium]